MENGLGAGGIYRVFVFYSEREFMLMRMILETLRKNP